MYLHGYDYFLFHFNYPVIWLLLKMATHFILKSNGKPNKAASHMFCNKHGNSKSVFKCKKIFNYILTYHNPLGNYAYNQGMQKNMQLLKYQMHSLKCIETLKMHRNLNDPHVASFKRIHYMQRWSYFGRFYIWKRIDMILWKDQHQYQNCFFILISNSFKIKAFTGIL